MWKTERHTRKVKLFDDGIRKDISSLIIHDGSCRPGMHVLFRQERTMLDEGQ